ncbi:hypothetical protein [Ruegeria sp. HKCCA5426]|uniref:hypothetical protein n=1 Tax=Ruegeria sp. HKCCA5426 TaxID=2682985 RepID=UPI0014888E3F|nr:hypothetical protein [Ruegeria sp. HKCCA5426]
MNKNTIKTAADGICQLEKLDRESPTVLATIEYLMRKHRFSHPEGEFDNARRFSLSAEEQHDCCVGIRTPSRAYPHSAMVHARTIAHVASLFDVDALDVRRLAKRIEAEASIPD